MLLLIRYKRILALVGVLLLLAVPAISFAQTASAPAPDQAKGTALYLEASQFLLEKKFPEAQSKFTEAAQYLTDKAQTNALKMADFVSRMTSSFTMPPLIDDPAVLLLGEVTESGKVWHLYSSKAGFSLLHLAILGQVDLPAMVAKFQPGSFTEGKVVRDTKGYVSVQTAYLPGTQSRMRLWYCARTNITNVIYENYQDPKSGEDLNKFFHKKVGCYPASGNWLYIVGGTVVLLIVAGLIFYGRWRKAHLSRWGRMMASLRKHKATISAMIKKRGPRAGGKFKQRSI